LVLRAIAGWLALAARAIVNGVIRLSLIAPRIGELGGHSIGTIVFCAVIPAVTWFTIGWIGSRDGTSALLIGLSG